MNVKRRFYDAIFERLHSEGVIQDARFIGTGRSQDYRVSLGKKFEVCIEAKGCPDGNNIRIWSRPTWAREFIIWSQCTHSLEKDPGHGIMSGISRLFRKAILESQKVDAFVFFDGRCGSDIRRCPKRFGVQGALRKKATDIQGQDGRAWLPPPCIYLFPATIPHPLSNKNPEPHDLTSCRFAAALLKGFGVPEQEQRANVHWARIEVKKEKGVTYQRISVGWGLDNKEPTCRTGWGPVEAE